jgi:hypothetical protein
MGINAATLHGEKSERKANSRAFNNEERRLEKALTFSELDTNETSGEI